MTWNHLRSAIFGAARPLRKPKGVEAPKDVVPETYQEIAMRLVDYPTIEGARYRSRELVSSWNGVDPDMIRFSLALTREFKRRGIPMIIHCLYRGEHEQNAAFERGNSRAKFGQSPHNYGMAVDIVHFGRWWNLRKKEWDLIGLIGKEVARRLNIPITWGGDWKNPYDPAHWQLSDWKARRDKLTAIPLQ